MNISLMTQSCQKLRFVPAANWISIFAVLALLATCGCQPMISKKSMIPWGSKKKEAKPIPDRILAVWTDTVLHQPGQTGVRGFGGRVYFYEKDKTDPIDVEGSLAVYAFDAEDDAIDSQKPLRKFVFTPEQLAGHMSKTSIGPSYSIWLPWSAVGDPPQKLSLITRFEGIDGGTTISDPVIKLLPGITKKSNSDKNSSPSASDKTQKQNAVDQGVQQASYSEPKSSNPTGGTGNRPVETIELPPGFHRHLKNSELLRKESEDSADMLQDMKSEIVTQVFDAKNPFPHSEASDKTVNDGSDDRDNNVKVFASSRPDRSNIRNGSWLKPDKRLKDGIERNQGK